MIILFLFQLFGLNHLFKTILPLILMTLIAVGLSSDSIADGWDSVLDPETDHVGRMRSDSDGGQNGQKIKNKLKVIFIRGKDARSYFSKEDSAYEKEIKKIIPNAKFVIDPTREKMAETLREAGQADILYINAHHPYGKGLYEDEHGIKMHSIGVASSPNNQQRSKGGTPIISAADICEALEGQNGPKLIIAAVCCTTNKQDGITGRNRLNGAFGISQKTRGRAYLGWGDEMSGLNSDPAFQRMLLKWIEASNNGKSITLDDLIHDASVWDQSDRTRPELIGDPTLVLNHCKQRFHVTLKDRGGKPIPNSKLTYNNGTVKGGISPDKIIVTVQDKKTSWENSYYKGLFQSEPGKEEKVIVKAAFKTPNGFKVISEKSISVSDHDLLGSLNQQPFHPVTIALPLYNPLAVLINLSRVGQEGQWPKQIQVREIRTRARGMDKPFTPKPNILYVEGGVDSKFVRLCLQEPIAAQSSINGTIEKNRLFIHFKAKIGDKNYEGNGEVDVPQYGGRCEMLILDIVSSEEGDSQDFYRSRSIPDLVPSGCMSMNVELKTEDPEGEAENRQDDSTDSSGRYMVWINKFGKGGRIHAGSEGRFKTQRRYIDEWLAGMSTEYLKKEEILGGQKFSTIEEAKQAACGLIGNKRIIRILGQGSVPGGDYGGNFYWIDGLGCEMP